MTATTRGRNVW